MKYKKYNTDKLKLEDKILAEKLIAIIQLEKFINTLELRQELDPDDQRKTQIKKLKNKLKTKRLELKSEKQLEKYNTTNV